MIDNFHSRFQVFLNEVLKMPICFRKLNFRCRVAHCHVMNCMLSHCYFSVFAGGKTYPNPSNIKDWIDDMKKWPLVEKPQILYYLVKSKARDLTDANAFRSMQSFTYMQSGWVGALFVHEIKRGPCSPERLSTSISSTRNISQCLGVL